MPEPVVTYPLRETTEQRGRQTARFALSLAALGIGAFMLSRGVMAIGGFVCAGGGVSLAVALRGARRLAEERGTLTLYPDRVVVAGLTTGDVELALADLEAYVETARGVAVVAMGAAAPVGVARSLVLRGDGIEVVLPEGWFSGPSMPSRFLRDLTEIQDGQSPSGPDAAVVVAPRDALDDRIDRELAALPDDD
jgi:hypothetical protein